MVDSDKLSLTIVIIRYRSCLDVLLQSQGSVSYSLLIRMVTNTQGRVKMQLGRVVNKKDRASVLGIARLSNTALHYAVQLWTELEVAASTLLSPVSLVSGC